MPRVGRICYFKQSTHWEGDIWAKTWERWRSLPCGYLGTEWSIVFQAKRTARPWVRDRPGVLGKQQGNQCGWRWESEEERVRGWNQRGKEGSRVADHTGPSQSLERLTFDLQEMGNCWRFCSRGVMWSDLAFKRISLETVLRRDCRKTRVEAETS